jgi:hypothetical protein
MEECKEEYTRDLLPQQLGVGVKFVAKVVGDEDTNATTRQTRQHYHQHRPEERLHRDMEGGNH